MALCPTCRRDLARSAEPVFPFCSRRCKLADLGNWLNDRYVVSEPLATPPADDEQAAQALYEALLEASQGKDPS